MLFGAYSALGLLYNACGPLSWDFSYFFDDSSDVVWSIQNLRITVQGVDQYLEIFLTFLMIVVMLFGAYRTWRITVKSVDHNL